MDQAKIWNKLVTIAGIGGVVYSVGFLVHLAHFKMLGVGIQVLDPVALAEIAGDFVFESVRILAAGIRAWAWIFVILFVLLVWYLRNDLFAKEFLQQMRNVRIVQAHGTKLEKLFLIGTVFLLFVWIVAFVVPLAFMNDFLAQTETAQYNGPEISLGGTIFSSLQKGDRTPLMFFYRIHVYLVAVSLLVLGSISIGRHKKSVNDSKNSPSTTIFPEWPRYLRMLANLLVGVNIFFLPISFGTIAKEPVFPNVRVIVDPEKTENDDIFGLNLDLKTGEDNYLIYRDAGSTYLYNAKTRRVMMLNTSSIYQVEFIPRHAPGSILQYVNRRELK